MAQEPSTGHAPIVIDLGKVRQKQIKALKQGRGALVREIDEVVAQVQAELGEEADGKELLPVVIVYRRKPKKQRRMFGW